MKSPLQNHQFMIWLFVTNSQNHKNVILVVDNHESVIYYEPVKIKGAEAQRAFPHTPRTPLVPAPVPTTPVQLSGRTADGGKLAVLGLGSNFFLSPEARDTRTAS